MVMKLSSCACLLPLACSLLPSALAEGFNGSLDFEQRIKPLSPSGNGSRI